MATTWTAPSVATLENSGISLECAPDLVRAIRKAESRAALYDVYPPAAEIEREFYNPPFFRELKRQCLDSAAGFYGVEYLGWHKRAREDVYYLNAGDSYAATLVFIGRTMVVSCWAYYVEQRLIKEAI